MPKMIPSAPGGGLIGDVDVELTDCKWGLWSYPSGGYEDRFAFFTRGKLLNPAEAELFGDAEGYAELHWNAGSPTEFQANPEDDGDTFLALGSNTELRVGTNYDIMLRELLNCGFPEAKFTDRAGCLNGLQVHLIRKPSPERKGLEKRERDAGVLVPSKIVKYPWAKAAAPAKTGAGTPTKPAGRSTSAAAKHQAAPPREEAEEAPAGAESNISVTALDTLAQVMDGNSRIELKNLPGLIFTRMIASNVSPAHRGEVRKFVATPEFRELAVEAGYTVKGAFILPIEQ